MLAACALSSARSATTAIKRIRKMEPSSFLLPQSTRVSDQVDAAVSGPVFKTLTDLEQEHQPPLTLHDSRVHQLRLYRPDVMNVFIING
ncbi:hypothetical protein J6590_003631 [Homalodisca vitripennis]|nr:hypothetical protein J6590_003631 [Homalodisca vitripennis]